MINRTIDLDLSDILIHEKSRYTEIEVKHLCAKITERYHSEGYTAFFIKRAIIRKDGAVEILFSEAKVSNISIKGINEEEQSLIINSLYKKDSVFNEHVLRQNIQTAKFRYALKKLSVDIVRTADDELSLNFTAERKKFGGAVSVSSNPLYGIYSDASININMGVIDTLLFYKTTMDIRKTGFTTAGAGISTASEKQRIFLNLDYTLREAPLDRDGEIFYSSRSAGVNTGLFYEQNAFSIKIYILSSLNYYDECSEYKDGISVTGAGCSLLYKDGKFKIDPSDVVNAGFTIVAGRNVAEGYQMVKMDLNGSFNLSLVNGITLTSALDSEYTSDDNKFFQYYVFDNKLPLREEDYTVSSFRNSFTGGLRFEAVNNLVYFVPEYIAAYYKHGNSNGFIDGYGIRAAAVLNTLIFNASVTLERGAEIDKAVYMFSASGSF